jgi:hypothetical protein
MKHTLFGKSALTALLVTILVGTLVGCSEASPQGDAAITLISIAVTSLPTKTVYTVGESLNLSGLVVTGTYSDGTTKQETVNASNVSGYNANTTGTQLLTVTVDGKTTTFSVTVNAASAATLQSIAVTSLPAKTAYTVGESLNLNGLVVTGTYSDGNTKTESVSTANVSGYNAYYTMGTQLLTVTVNGKITTFSVTVTEASAATLQSIAVASLPAKTTYTVGESLDLSGIVVIGTYSDGNTKAETVSTSNISGYNANTTGTQLLTVTVDGKTATFSVTVNAVDAATLWSIEITSWPAKTYYTVGESLDLSGIVVIGTYSDGNTKQESVSTANVSGYDAYTAGTQTLTVMVNGHTATFNVIVNAASAATLWGIEITNLPYKTYYTVGESLDLSGLVVIGTYSDGTTQYENVSTANMSWYDAYSIGTQLLTVTVNGRTATFSVTVTEASAATLWSIEITSLPYKTYYTVGEPLDLNGLVVTGTYSDWTTKQESVSTANISGYDAYVEGTQYLTVTVNNQTASFNVTVTEASAATLWGIEITSLPYKTYYTAGESLDLSGLVVIGTYSDWTTKQETVTTANISGYDAYAEGSQTLTVMVNGMTATFSVTVTAASAGTLQSIEITSLPYKTYYTVGESLDLSGLVVIGTYSDWATQQESVSESNVSGYDAYTTGTQTLTVIVSGRTASFNVIVNAASAATLWSIEITSWPTKTDYTVGESLNLNGLVVIGTYSDGTTKQETVTTANISGYDAYAEGTQYLTVTVNNQTASFNVTVTAPTPQYSSTFTISLDDPINGVESDIALSRTGAGEMPASIALAITGTYADYEWYLNAAQTPVSRTATWTVNATDCLLGKNFLTVRVRTSEGAYYAKELTFNVSK